MSVNTYGGGNQTNINGLKFEQETSLNDALLLLKGYSINESTILYNNEEIGLSIPQTHLYTKFLKQRGIDYKKYTSKQYRPNEALYLYKTNTMYIIEKNFNMVLVQLMKNCKLVILIGNKNPPCSLVLLI